MKNTKLAAALIAPIMFLSVGMAKATEYGNGHQHGNDCDCQATVEVSAKLPEVCKLTLNGGNVVTTIGCDNGALGCALTPSFKLYSNKKNDFELTAKDETTSGKVNAFFADGGNRFLSLANSSTKPTAAAVANCGSGSPVAANNANCICYPITTVVAAGASSGALSYGSNKYTYDNVLPGTTTFTLTTGTHARTNTFSVGNDTAGVYKAELIATASGI